MLPLKARSTSMALASPTAPRMPRGVTDARRPSASPGPFADDPLLKEFFDQFFGPRSPGNRGEFHQPGLGSGVIVDSRGYVLTNFHVIKGADGVIVRLSSKREYRGRIVGTDAKADLHDDGNPYLAG